MTQEMKNILDRVIELLKEKYTPEKIILFGSYACGKPTKESDVDLLIVVKEPLDFHSRHKFLNDFQIPIQLVFISLEEFLETKDVVGGIAYPASKYGEVLYENS